jgi:glutamate racemase
MNILDSSEIVAAALKNYLETERILNQAEHSEQHFLVSDYTDSFEASARMFFHESVHLERHPLWTLILRCMFRVKKLEIKTNNFINLGVF